MNTAGRAPGKGRLVVVVIVIFRATPREAEQHDPHEGAEGGFARLVLPVNDGQPGREPVHLPPVKRSEVVHF